MATVQGNFPEPLQPETAGLVIPMRPVDDFPSAVQMSAAPLPATNTEAPVVGFPAGVGERTMLQRLAEVWKNTRGRRLQLEYLSTDVFFLVINSCIAIYLYSFAGHLTSPISQHDARDLAKSNFAVLLLYAVLTMLFCQNYGLYRSRRTRPFSEEAVAVAKAMLLATALIAGFVWLAAMPTFSWTVLTLTAVMNASALTFWRYRDYQRAAGAGARTRNVLIIGAGPLGQQVARSLERNKHLGYQVKGFLDDTSIVGNRVLGSFADFPQVARAHFIEEVFLAIPNKREQAAKAALEARNLHIDVRLVPDLYDGLGWRAPVDYIGEFPVLALHREPIPAFALLVKRIMDVLVSGLGLILTAPLCALIAIAIKLDSPGPVLYRSYRVGKKGHRFTFYKFRTMVQNADALKAQLRALNERQGPFFKMANDPRITRIGRILRKYSLDELPQLWNVLAGDMSLVGPRPHPLDDYQQYSLEHLRRLDVTPGITGLWQVSARRDSSWDINMALDLDYIEHWSPWRDIKILLKTIPIVVRGMGQ